MIKKISTSWDDGSPEDMKIAELLDRYNIEGTFYIPIFNLSRKVLTKYQIKQLSKKFEIGAHTLSHVDLTRVNLYKAKEEIFRGKEELEQIIGKRVYKFSFPWGRYNKDIIKLVREAGFISARTARIFFVGKQKRSSFLQHPNLHIFNHHKLVYLLSCIKYKDFRSLSFLLSLNKTGFLNIASSFSQSEIHIWGHSWEVLEKGLFEDLRNLFHNLNYGEN